MAVSEFSIRFDGVQMNPFWGEFLSLADAGKLPFEVVQLLLDRPDALFELRAVEGHGGAAASADHLLVGLYPTDLLRRLMPASGAGDAEFGFVEHASNHASSPCASSAGVKEDGSVATGHPHNSTADTAIRPSATEGE